MKNEKTSLIFLFYVNEFKVAHSVTDTEKVSLFYSTRKTTNLIFGFIEIKIFVDNLFMNEFMSAATRNISNLLRRICIIFPVCGFFLLFTPQFERGLYCKRPVY